MRAIKRDYLAPLADILSIVLYFPFPQCNSCLHLPEAFAIPRSHSALVKIEAYVPYVTLLTRIPEGSSVSSHQGEKMCLHASMIKLLVTCFLQKQKYGCVLILQARN